MSSEKKVRCGAERCGKFWCGAVRCGAEKTRCGRTLWLTHFGVRAENHPVSVISLVISPIKSLKVSDFLKILLDFNYPKSQSRNF